MTDSLAFVIFYYGTGLIVAYNYIKVQAEGLKDKIFTVLAVMNLWPVMMSAAVYKSTEKDTVLF